MGRITVLAFIGSPRRGGNTETLVASVMKGVARAGAVGDTIRLADLSIAPCMGCGGCQKSGHCVIMDNMQPLYDKILAAQAVILASPIYFYALSAQTKLFVDRLQALWSRKQLLMSAGQWLIDPGKCGYLVSVAATKGDKIFVGAQLTAQYAFDAMGYSYCGDLLVRGVDQRGAIKTMSDKLLEAEEFGVNICRRAVSGGQEK